ncbi:MAG: hypothetical protein ACI96W_002823 [Paraglaciecola sp.]|jgi:hypothetical protein
MINFAIQKADISHKIEITFAQKILTLDVLRYATSMIKQRIT